GKTIEAGLIWTELVARFDAHRLLVVCPKSLTEKWRQELWQKFSVDAKIVDATGLMEALRRDAEGADGLVTGRSSEKRSCDGPCPRAPAPFVFPNVVSERVLIVALSVVRGCPPRLRHKIRVPIPPASLRRTEADYRCQDRSGSRRQSSRGSPRPYLSSYRTRYPMTGTIELNLASS